MERKWIQVGLVVTDGQQSLMVGDVVQYSATGTGYRGKWRFLGLSDAGKLLIMSEECVDQISLQGRTGYEDGIDRINGVCAAYGKGYGAKCARSITIEDVRKLERFDELHSMIFGKNDSAIYWLASQFTHKHNRFAEYGIQIVSMGTTRVCPLIFSDGPSLSDTLGVRAVVELKDNIKLTKISTWTF